MTTPWSLIYAKYAQEMGDPSETERALALSEPLLRQGEAWLAAEFHRIRARAQAGAGRSWEETKATFDVAEGIADEQGATLFLRRVRSDRDQALAAYVASSK